MGIYGLVLAVQHGGENLSYWGHNTKFSLPGFIKAFNSCFFFFAGFEVFSTAGRNISNPEKNIGSGIILIMLISTIFYIVISIIFFAAFNHFVQNMNIGTWSLGFNNKLILYGGPIIMIISALSLKVNVAMQNALYGGTSLQPLSTEVYLPDRLRKLNKDGLPARASILNLVITSLIIFIWLAIPDIIKGVGLTKEFWFMATPAQAMTYQQPFDISSLTEASSAITIFIYAMVIAVTLKLGYQRKIKMRLWEHIAFPIVFIILCFVFVWHYYSLIDNIVSTTGTNANWVLNNAKEILLRSRVAKLLELKDVSDSLQTLFKNNNLKIVLEQESSNIVNLQLDATEIEGYTGQAILRLAVKIKQEVLDDAIKINGVANLNKGANNVYETTTFKKHFEPLLKLYDKPVKFSVDTWTGYLPTLGLPIALSQNQKKYFNVSFKRKIFTNAWNCSNS